MRYQIHVDGLSGEVDTSYGAVLFDENGDGICTLEQTWAFAGDRGFCVQLLPGQPPTVGAAVEDVGGADLVVETIPVETEAIAIPDPTAEEPIAATGPTGAEDISGVEEGNVSVTMAATIPLESNSTVLPEPTEAPEPGNEPDAEAEGTTPGVVGSTYADLRAMAKARGIKYVGVTKADLIAALQPAETPV
jgi:hypothetical protein